MRGVAHAGDPPQMGHNEADAVRSVRLKGKKRPMNMKRNFFTDLFSNIMAIS
jgi:hypothetical protein